MNLHCHKVTGRNVFKCVGKLVPVVIKTKYVSIKVREVAKRDQIANSTFPNALSRFTQ